MEICNHYRQVSKRSLTNIKRTDCKLLTQPQNIISRVKHWGNRNGENLDEGVRGGVGKWTLFGAKTATFTSLILPFQGKPLIYSAITLLHQNRWIERDLKKQKIKNKIKKRSMSKAKQAFPLHNTRKYKWVQINRHNCIKPLYWLPCRNPQA